jgi:hypothetical protein
MVVTLRYSASFARCRRVEVLRRMSRLVTYLAATWLVAQPTIATSFESGRAEFAVTVNDLEVPYRVFALFVLPGEVFSFEADGAVVSADAAHASPEQSGSGWRWRAPDSPGIYRLEVARGSHLIALNVFVMVPRERVRNERLNDYRIGSYPSEPLNGNPLYEQPDGFIELTEANADTQLSPHFRLSQFPSKQSGGYPKYLVLREQLVLKLELLLEALNNDGRAAETLTIMSGYRTPFYNAAIRNVPYSRHVYGGAADIYVDESPRDGHMDDLNRDGRIDYRDAQHLLRLADTLFRDVDYVDLRGGMGVYRRNAAHGPFLHIDARQQRARWGELP